MAKKLKPFEKLITVMISGKPVTVEEIEATLGNEIHMYRLSTYIWHIKEFANGTVKTVKDGKKVVSYQITNVSDVQKYIDESSIDIVNFVPGKASKIVRKGALKSATAKSMTQKMKTVKATKPVKKISDLNAKSEKKVKPVKVKKEKSVVKEKELFLPEKDIIEVLEITEDFDSEVNDIVDDIRSNTID
jgi:hypothetical protein